jgi:hypothetical protein
MVQELSPPSFHTSNATISASDPALSPKQLPENPLFREPTYSASDASPGFICIPHCITPIQRELADDRFFLNYHRENITEFHYFRYYDHRKQCNDMLLQMADKSVALGHAIMAFSALLFFMKTEGFPGEEAFEYYSSSLVEFRQLLDRLQEPLVNHEDVHTAVATALQLSSFDVSPLNMSRLKNSNTSAIPQRLIVICKVQPTSC